jgi:hypothetical protein
VSLLNADRGELRSFHEWIDNREEGLALDELAHLGESSAAPPPNEFWSLLRLAADLMGLGEESAPHEEAMRIISRH